MVSHRGDWAALWSKFVADGRPELSGVRQAQLRRQVAWRMRLHGIDTYDDYLHLLQGKSSELAALNAALRSHIHRPARAMARSRAPARRWVDALPIPALLAEATAAGGRRLRLVSCNRPARKLLAAPELALRPASPRHRWLLPNLTPCTGEELPMQQALRGGITCSQTLLLRDAAGRLQPLVVSARRLGTSRPARAIVTLQPATWQTEQGAGTLLTRFNETQALRDRYQRLFAHSAAPLLVTSSDGTIVEANAAAATILGASGSLAGSALAGHLSADAQPLLEEAIRTALAAGEAQAQLPPLAEGQLLEAHARRLAMDGGELIQWALHDITAQAEVERQRADLTDMVLHDLRGPLATLLLGEEAAARALQRGDAERAQQSLAIAQMSLRRMRRLIDSLLDISRLEAGPVELALSPVEIDKLLAELAREAAPVAAANDLRLEIDAPLDLPPIIADYEMIYRAAFNLLDNAIKFSPPKSFIRLRAARQDGSLAVSVADQGPGIPPELLPHIFDKFVGLHLPHAPRGYGLGLAFCKLAVEAHGGRITVDSAPGHGSVFTLQLPLHQPGGHLDHHPQPRYNE